MTSFFLVLILSLWLGLLYKAPSVPTVDVQIKAKARILKGVFQGSPIIYCCSIGVPLYYITSLSWVLRICMISLILTRLKLCCINIQVRRICSSVECLDFTWFRTANNETIINLELKHPLRLLRSPWRYQSYVLL